MATGSKTVSKSGTGDKLVTNTTTKTGGTSTATKVTDKTAKGTTAAKVTANKSTGSTAKATATGTTALSDLNIRNYKKQLDEITKQINLWEKALSEAETNLNSSIGATFKANYAVGAKATTNIQKVIDILQSCKSDLKKLLTAGNEYYKKISAAAKK